MTQNFLLLLRSFRVFEKRIALVLSLWLDKHTSNESVVQVIEESDKNFFNEYFIWEIAVSTPLIKLYFWGLLFINIKNSIDAILNI